jgi:hypothetical protein
LVTGGTMVGAKRTSADQMVATSIEGGDIHHLSWTGIIPSSDTTPTL